MMNSLQSSYWEHETSQPQHILADDGQCADSWDPESSNQNIPPAECSKGQKAREVAALAFRPLLATICGRDALIAACGQSRIWGPQILPPCFISKTFPPHSVDVACLVF